MRAALVALALWAGVVLVLIGLFGWGSFLGRWSHLEPRWLVLVAAAEGLAFLAYALPYRALARVRDGPRLPFALALRAVVAGFGPFELGGGLVIDKRTLHALEDDEHAATVRVLGLGAIEWALLAPAACLTAAILTVEGDSRVIASVRWPWMLAVPVGASLALWASAPHRHHHAPPEHAPRWRRWLATTLQGIALLHTLARDPRRWWSAWVGTALYWTFDIASLYAAVRFVGLRPTLGEAILAYATGYALTRRSTPLAGAGSTETLMTFALHWSGQPLTGALAAVVVYRAFNFLLPTIPALFVHPRMKSLLDAEEERSDGVALTREETVKGEAG
jgi:uncharacterized membrane protein YbhN (UPF0104 family)